MNCHTHLNHAFPLFFPTRIIPIYLVHRPSNAVPYATLEEELIGDFVKYSVRDGKEINLKRSDSEAGQKCCAFQHWVYDNTDGNLLVTDMQGQGNAAACWGFDRMRQIILSINHTLLYVLLYVLQAWVCDLPTLESQPVKKGEYPQRTHFSNSNTSYIVSYIFVPLRSQLQGLQRELCHVVHRSVPSLTHVQQVL